MKSNANQFIIPTIFDVFIPKIRNDNHQNQNHIVEIVDFSNNNSDSSTQRGSSAQNNRQITKQNISDQEIDISENNDLTNQEINIHPNGYDNESTQISRNNFPISSGIGMDNNELEIDQGIN